jgi:hypothetical protein
MVMVNVHVPTNQYVVDFELHMRPRVSLKSTEIHLIPGFTVIIDVNRTIISSHLSFVNIKVVNSCVYIIGIHDGCDYNLCAACSANDGVPIHYGDTFHTCTCFVRD